MKKYLFTLVAMMIVGIHAQAQNFLDFYRNGQVVSSVRAADIDSMVIGTSSENRAVYFYKGGNIFHYMATASVDSVKVFSSHGASGYVDLGLPSGTLWATCNIGADYPEDYGDYFAWGETKGYNSGKTNFSWSTYQWCNGSYNTLTKYNKNSGNGTVDNKTELDLEDDAAYVNWGPEWRMPSKAQFEELINSSYTTTEWTTLNGVKGRKITSKKNGNSIFLPAAGFRYDSSLSERGSYGHYWSRTLSSGGPGLAWYLGFTSNYIYTSGSGYRYWGQSVRPVRLSE